MTIGTKSPLFPFSSLEELTLDTILWAKKEAVGRTYGFGKINCFYRGEVEKAIMLVRERELLLPWALSSYLRVQPHQEVPLLPWTSHERPQEPHAEARR